MSRGFVLALAGAISSGKTTVARAVQAATGARVVGFGDLVRHEAERRGLATTRSALQELGQGLLEEMGPRKFCEMALANAEVDPIDRPVIWDGVRHPEIMRSLEDIYDPGPIELVVLMPDETARRKRAAAQAKSPDELAAWESDETERHIGELAHQADFVCDANSPERAVAEVLRVIDV